MILSALFMIISILFHIIEEASFFVDAASFAALIFLMIGAMQYCSNLVIGIAKSIRRGR